jgi:hypothetical protein
MHSRISIIRIFQFLGCTNCLAQDIFSQFLTERLWRDQIYFAPKGFFQIKLKPCKFK